MLKVKDQARRHRGHSSKAPRDKRVGQKENHPWESGKLEAEHKGVEWLLPHLPGDRAGRPSGFSCLNRDKPGAGWWGERQETSWQARRFWHWPGWYLPPFGTSSTNLRTKRSSTGGIRSNFSPRSRPLPGQRSPETDGISGWGCLCLHREIEKAYSLLPWTPPGLSRLSLLLCRDRGIRSGSRIFPKGHRTGSRADPWRKAAFRSPSPCRVTAACLFRRGCIAFRLSL